MFFTLDTKCYCFSKSHILITEEIHSNTFPLKRNTNFLSKLISTSHAPGLFYSTAFHSK